MGEKRFLTGTTLVSYRTNGRTYICYTTVYPKSPRILRKVSGGKASNASTDILLMSIFFSVLFLPFIAGGCLSAASIFFCVFATYFFSTIFLPTGSSFGAGSPITYLVALSKASTPV